MSNQSEPGTTVVRRRRTSRHRRNRRIRRALLITLCAATTLSFSLLALHSLTPSLFKAAAPRRTDKELLAERAAQAALVNAQQESARQMEKRPMYPYSVVSGGVRDVAELKFVAEHDPIVASHYAGFDYARARLVRVALDRSVFVSYRVGNHVYWTRRRVALKKGETLLTDGKMTARTRCGNRVEETPQQESSKMEPPAVMFDQPVMPAEAPAVPFQTSMLNRPTAPGLGPTLPLGLYDPIGGSSWAPIAPPPLPNVCGLTAPKKTGVKGTEVAGVGAEAVSAKGGGKKKNSVDPCGGGGGGTGGEVPEPGTWLLVASGMAVLYWKARHRFVRT